jgi:hypothetical protein
MQTRKYRVRVSAVWVDTGDEWSGELETFGYSARDAAQRFIDLTNYLQHKRNNGTGRYRSLKSVEMLGVRDWGPGDFDEDYADGYDA